MTKPRSMLVVLTVLALAWGLSPVAAQPAAGSGDGGEGTAGTASAQTRPGRTGWPDPGPLGPPPTVDVGGTEVPAANPYLGLLPSTYETDWGYWRRYVARGSARLAEKPPAERAELAYEELEPDDVLGANDRSVRAEPIPGFGTGTGEEPDVAIQGHLTQQPVAIRKIERSREDDGAIPLARQTRIGVGRAGIATTGRSGDGPHGENGSGSGDFDYYKVRVDENRQIIARARARGGSDIEPLIAIWDKKGRLRDFAFPRGNQVQLKTPLPAGTYYVMVVGCCTYPRNRFKSGSGTGAESQGRYRFSVQVSRPDRDFYAIDLAPGEVLGGSVQGARSMRVYEPDGSLVFGSRYDASFIYPDSTLLPGGGNAVVDHVVSTAGRYTVEVVFGAGDYKADLELYRTGAENEPAGARQTLFLDFDGERLNTNIFGGGGVSQLSPLSAFLGRWGLGPAREDAVIDAVLDTVRENVRRDLARRGLNDSFDVEILNSRDDPDPWGQDNVSRVIVGGTIRESRVFTIGIAESIDPGNLDQEESALVLLDLISGPERRPYSINHFLRPRSDRVAFIGQVLGNLVAHEAGHYLGNWHVDPFDASPNLMDPGNNIHALFGPGPDGVGGTADDRDVDCGVGRLSPFEPFKGFEDTLNRTAFGLTGGG